MKRPGHLLEHEGDEFLLLEGGYNDDVRSVTVLCRPDNTRFEAEDNPPAIQWLDQGEWLPLARWSPEELVARHTAHKDLLPFLREVLDAYEAERYIPEPLAWAVGTGDGVLGLLVETIPMGIAVILHDDVERAENAAREASVEAWADVPDQGDGAHRVFPVLNLGQFFTHLVRQGYAGCLWNHELPVYFCIDKDGDLQFLRVVRGTDGANMELLDTNDRWIDYEGDRQIDVLDNREACDKRLTTELGAVPLHEWAEVETLFLVGPAPDDPVVVVDEENGLRYAVLFTTEDYAREWCEEAEQPGWSVHALAVDQLLAVLSAPQMAECVAQLNPGRHRAVNGMMWGDGEAVVLDSFSGFWRLVDGSFEAIERDEDEDGEE